MKKLIEKLGLEPSTVAEQNAAADLMISLMLIVFAVKVSPLLAILVAFIMMLVNAGYNRTFYCMTRIHEVEKEAKTNGCDGGAGCCCGDMCVETCGDFCSNPNCEGC